QERSCPRRAAAGSARPSSLRGRLVARAAREAGGEAERAPARHQEHRHRVAARAQEARAAEREAAEVVAGPGRAAETDAGARRPEGSAEARGAAHPPVAA